MYVNSLRFSDDATPESTVVVVSVVAVVVVVGVVVSVVVTDS